MQTTDEQRQTCGQSPAPTPSAETPAQKSVKFLGSMRARAPSAPTKPSGSLLSRRALATIAVGLAALAASVTSGCASSTAPLRHDPIPANLMVKCERMTPLRNGSFEELTRWAIANGVRINDCIDRQNGLVDAVTIQQNADKDNQ